MRINMYAIHDCICIYYLCLAKGVSVTKPCLCSLLFKYVIYLFFSSLCSTVFLITAEGPLLTGSADQAPDQGPAAQSMNQQQQQENKLFGIGTGFGNFFIGAAYEKTDK